MTNVIIQELDNVSDRSALKDLKELVDLGVFRNTLYKLNCKFLKKIIVDKMWI